ncbi:MAG: fumarylacetoacetate hydrolase family protein [Chloroflexi bacterium]|nr:fumarylacetoacetate hydrolase family protein [Chloroflexota bacterium]
MRLASFSFEDTTRVGVVVEDEIVDLYLGAPDAPTDMCEFLAMGEDARVMAEMAVERGGNRRPLSEVQLLSPVPNPKKFLAVGLNYGDHIAETGAQTPRMPTIFTKQVSCVQRPGGGVQIPLASKAVDYEGELGIVIGETCRHVSAADASSVIAGYTIVNDVSVRDFQRHTPQFTMGKSFDTHGPVGPVIVTGDELGDPHVLDIQTSVNGELRQNSNTKHLIFDCYDIVEYVTQAMTLEPGDIIATGTPSGVAAAMTPPRWLVAGDTVSITIAGIGTLENTCVPEPEASHDEDHH